MIEQRLSNIRVVLVGTTHPGNIGAAARAMRTMGLSDLALVEPRHFPSAEATARASGSDQILQEAQVTTSLTEALQECALVIATTARMRSLPWPVMSPREMSEKVIGQCAANKVAIVFGREHSGLTNEELAFCNAAVTIPTVDDYSSLNLASAVQILAYEIRLAGLSAMQNKVADEERSLATTDQMELFYQHLEQTMIDLAFYNPEKPKLLMRKMRRLFSRAELDNSEVQMLRGLLSASQKNNR